MCMIFIHSPAKKLGTPLTTVHWGKFLISQFTWWQLYAFVHVDMVCIRESLITQHIKSWGKWATAAENHIWCHSCQLRTGKWGNNLDRLTINDTRRSEKCCLVWCVLISCATLRWNGQNLASATWKHGSTLPYINVSGWRYDGIRIFS